MSKQTPKEKDLARRLRYLREAFDLNTKTIESQAGQIRHERLINERLTREKLEMERRLQRAELQRRAALLILESGNDVPVRREPLNEVVAGVMRTL